MPEDCTIMLRLQRTITFFCLAIAMPALSKPKTVESMETLDLGWVALLMVLLIMLAMVGVGTSARWLAQFIAWPKKATTNSSENFTAPLSIDERQRFVQFVIMALFFVALAYIGGWAELPYIAGRHESATREYLGDLLFAIATAALVSFTFSRVLDLPEVSNEFVKKLNGIVSSEEHSTRTTTALNKVLHSEEYLLSLNANGYLYELRDRLDRALYGGASLSDKDSLYNFVAGRLSSQYSQPFRRDVVIQLNCEQDATCLRWEESRTFYYIPNGTTDPEFPELHFSTMELLTQSWLDTLGIQNGDPDTQSKALLDTIEAGTLIVGVSGIGFLKYVYQPGDKTLTLDKNATDVTKLGSLTGKESIAVTSRALDENLRWRFGYDFAFPAAFRTKDVREVKVETFIRRKKPIRDDVYYLDLRRPARNISLTCRFPPGIRLEFAKFQMKGHDELSLDELRPRESYGFSRIDGWALPGHGLCVAWYGFGRDHPSAQGAGQKQPPPPAPEPDAAEEADPPPVIPGSSM